MDARAIETLIVASLVIRECVIIKLIPLSCQYPTTTNLTLLFQLIHHVIFLFKNSLATRHFTTSGRSHKTQILLFIMESVSRLVSSNKK